MPKKAGFVTAVRSGLVLGIMFIFMIPAVAAAEEAVPFYAALRTSSSPVIDGILNDTCWRKAELTRSFVAIGGKEVRVKTRGMLSWDKKNLYIAFTCEEPLMEVLKERIKEGDISPFEESVEIFIDSNDDRSTYLQFRVGILGEKDSRRGYEIDRELNGKWSAAVSLNKDSWTVEAAIPFAVLGAEPLPRALWGLNLNRQRMIEVKGKWTCWSDTKGGFHSPARFGHLIFSNYSAWLNAYFGSQIDGLIREIKSLGRDYPKLTAPFQDTLAQDKKDYRDFLRKVSAANIDSGDKCTPFYNEGKSVVGKYEDAFSRLQLAVVQGEFGKGD